MKSFYLNKWYGPVVISGLIGISCVFLITIPYKYSLEIALCLPFLALSISLLLGIIRIFRKEYQNGIAQVIFTIILGFIGLTIGSLLLVFYPFDHFASNLEIPADITYNIPKDSKVNALAKNFDFVIYNSSQPGIYKYDVLLQNIKGTVYLKAYEVTGNIPLSEEELRQETSIFIENGDMLRIYTPSGDFVIHEGDWGDQYLARFELWLTPNNGSPEKKLSEKIYKIEGWMR